MGDESFQALFEPIMEEVVSRYRPEAVVLQSGADSLSGDRLGRFNLTIKGHAACHRFMMKFGLPMLVVGGGGYKIKNVARCWAYETAVLLGARLGACGGGLAAVGAACRRAVPTRTCI